MGLLNIEDILKKAELPSAIFLFGEEDFLIEEALNNVLNKFCPDRANDYNFKKFRSDELTIAELLDQCNAFPMLGDAQVFVLKDFEKYFSGRVLNSDKRPDQLRSYFSNMPSTTKVIITCKDKKLFGVKKKGLKSVKAPYDSIIENSDSVEFEKVWPSSYPTWIKNRFSKLNKKVSEKAISLIISQTQESLRDISNQIDKILNFLPDQDSIDADEIMELVGQSKDHNVFELQKAVARRDLSSSLKIAENMLSTSRQEIYILSVLTNYFYSVFRLIEARSSASNKYELASILRVNPYFVPDYTLALNVYSYEEIEKVFFYLEDADHVLKTSSSDAKMVISKLLNQIIGK